MIEIFEYDYGYKKLLNNPKAQAAYLPCTIASFINAIIVFGLITLIALSLHNIIYTNLGVSPKSELYNRTEKSYHRSLIRLNTINYILVASSTIARAVYVYLRGQVIFIQSSATTIGSFSHKLSFWPLILMAISIPYIIFCFYYTSVLKDEIKMALDEAE